MSSDQGGEPQLQEEAEPGPKTRGEDEITPGTGGDSGVMVSRGLFSPPQQDDRSLAGALLINRVIGSMIARYIRPSVGSHSLQAWHHLNCRQSILLKTLLVVIWKDDSLISVLARLQETFLICGWTLHHVCGFKIALSQTKTTVRPQKLNFLTIELVKTRMNIKWDVRQNNSSIHYLLPLGKRCNASK